MRFDSSVTVYEPAYSSPPKRSACGPAVTRMAPLWGTGRVSPANRLALCTQLLRQSPAHPPPAAAGRPRPSPVHRGAPHHFRRRQPAAHRQVRARTAARLAETHPPAGGDLHRHPHRQVRAEIRAGQGDHGRALEFQFPARQRHLQAGGIFGVAHQQVAGAQGHRIGRAGGRNAVMRPAEAAQVLHRGQQPRRQHANPVHAGGNRTRSPMRSSGGGSAEGSNSRSAVRPISRHPPGEASG